jgi:hypothetical protein
VPLDVPEVWVGSAVGRRKCTRGRGTDGSVAGPNTCMRAIPPPALDANRVSSIATVP